jgi:uncharacterized membrane protein YgcG
MSSERKKRGAAKPENPPLNTTRMAELAALVVDHNYALGPQDEADLVEALRELVDRRHAEVAA